ncbi:ABC transporter substrate-binding protein [Pollutimonas bauzanensis]|uniref:Peptide/nickel transport system substrate-binding protein n=1 Tax=Pollutimonas bauzanensis TaxID=658167 RepID=A0A1M5SMB7_9BURK|nr:ABC transporter substrate-binding protein [Pollutimonas bauzanensis]SHH39580.1 peptide/nickel transport system substrate-binding protein [Pollutimonas bauzanensis]
MKYNLWRAALRIAFSLSLGAAVPAGALAAAQAAAQPERGGTLNIAYPANPATLDPHLTTNQATRDVARNIFEQLLTLDDKYQVVPELAESFRISDDGLAYTFVLRKGISFHNGQPLTADDVVASMDKWLKTSTQGKANLQGARFAKVDDATVRMTLEKPSLLGPNILADTAPFPGIMPKSVIDAAGGKGIAEYIGTGPYKLKEWRPDQYVLLTRYDGYVSRTEPSSGLAGAKHAWLDNIYFRYVTDESTRLAGIITGEYDLALGLPLDNAAQIDATDGVSNYFASGGTITYVFNKAQGPFADLKLRQAFNEALDYNAALVATYSDPRFFELDPSLSLPTQAQWHTTAGKPYYNRHDLDAARKLVKESGYKGEEVVILTTRDYPEHFSFAVVAQQTLKSIGVKSRLDVYDWATLQERRRDPKNFDVFAMTFAVRPTINQNPYLASSAKYAGLSNSPEIDRSLAEITAAPSLAAARPLIERLEKEVWEYLPVVKVGNIQQLYAVRDNVRGLDDLIGPVLWNVYLAKK